ncbi:GNAT family N-acetyltransferase [Konateibacter massiliensis]|uniref:GNAT family N-acetyltransferase n=1 Tax=Konateibacter massiliensis TaxID=2002841 RepID=UPI000C1503D5|nr:GNAT family N-acetyltransferase [Konateibacter massiliensis]
MEIRKIEEAEREKAIKLIDAVFMQFEAPDYSNEGVKTFKDTAIYNEDYMNELVMYGAYHNAILVGVIATRNEGNHIALFFVEGKHHKQGIGKMLFQKVLENRTSAEITVNSSPYAVKIYRCLGFVDTAKEQMRDGIRYTPMMYRE